jgi:hypothetical protein
VLHRQRVRRGRERCGSDSTNRNRGNARLADDVENWTRSLCGTRVRVRARDRASPHHSAEHPDSQERRSGTAVSFRLKRPRPDLRSLERLQNIASSRLCVSLSPIMASRTEARQVSFSNQIVIPRDQRRSDSDFSIVATRIGQVRLCQIRSGQIRSGRPSRRSC